MTKRADIIDAARTFLGTPFHHQGRAKGAGIDCIGLLVGAASEAGIAIQDRIDYPRQPIPAELLADLAANLDPVESMEPSVADVLVFWIADEWTPQHVGLATDVGMIHAWAGGRQRVQEHGMTQGWRARLHSVWRFRGLED